MQKKYLLNERWQFRLNESLNKGTSKVISKKWYDAFVPGTVYHNLLVNKLIPDPFYADNELQLQWIARTGWSYRTFFKLPEDYDPAKQLYLVFDGLDTYSEIFLNEEKVGTTNNMFVKYEFEISNLLKSKNTLEIRFASPYTYAKALEARFGKLHVALDSERVYIRKAQYSFGWDWGPSFADIGIWKNVSLLQKEEHFIESFTFDTINLNETKAKVQIKLNFNKNLGPQNKIIVNISGEENSYSYIINHNNNKSVNAKLDIPNPRLWWPNGEGEQFLYNIKVTLFRNDFVEDELIRKTGLRIIELQLKDNGKNTFRFKINGRKIFAKGTNWIPADSFLTRIDDNKYKTLLLLAKQGNMNFIRVWGGGVYEHDKFYETCDELGLLVWQDFMFACAAYPEYKEFIVNVSEEFRQNISRLQYHPSIAIWCGNNECEGNWFKELNKSYKEMTGYKIFSEVIPGILGEIDPGRPYWESSPFSLPVGDAAVKDPNSVASGNRHQWDLWSKWIDYDTVKDDTSLFVTEFGFQGPANQSTFEKVIPVEQRNPQSYLFEFHNKQIEGNERQFKFLSGHLPVRTGWSDFIYLAQLSQGLALKTCVEAWRLKCPETNGSIIWQLNDCWPVSSWSLIDSDVKPKLSYYLVKQSFSGK